MLLYLVICVLIFPSAFGSPVVEMIEVALTSQDSKQTEVHELNWDSYLDRQDRYFDDWFDWIKEPNRKRPPTVQQRLQTLEKKQMILYELLRCESIGEDNCEKLRNKMDEAFSGPAAASSNSNKKKRPNEDQSAENGNNKPNNSTTATATTSSSTENTTSQSTTSSSPSPAPSTTTAAATTTIATTTAAAAAATTTTTTTNKSS